MRALAEKPKFGYVREISGQDYVEEVNKAGEGIFVVLHLYVHPVSLTFSGVNKFIISLQIQARNSIVRVDQSIYGPIGNSFSVH